MRSAVSLIFAIYLSIMLLVRGVRREAGSSKFEGKAEVREFS